jgi:drug/metabolite transporter (DMT)-like permease
MIEKTAPAASELKTPKSEIAFGATDLALIAMTLIWGLNFIAVKTTLIQITPFAFVSTRFLIAGTLLYLLVRVRQHGFGIPRSAWRKVAVLGIIGTAIYQPLFIGGLALTKASNSALILSITPTFILLLNRILHKESFTRRGWIGVLLSFSGVAFIVQSGGDLLDSANLLGDALILVAAFCWSLYSVLAAPLLRTYSPLSLTAFSTVVGTIPLLLLGMPAILAQDWASVTLAGWTGLFFSATFAVVVALVIWNLGVQRIGGARTAIYNNLTPVIATLAAALFLGEPLTPLKIAGAVVIFLGLYLARTTNVVLEPEG